MKVVDYNELLKTMKAVYSLLNVLMGHSQFLLSCIY